MRSLPYLLLLLTLAVACKPDNDQSDQDPSIFDREIITTQLGNEIIYGFRMQVGSDENENRSYHVQFSRNEAVWLDTIELQLIKGDTLEVEKYYSDAVVQDLDHDLLQLEIKSVRIE